MGDASGAQVHGAGAPRAFDRAGLRVVVLSSLGGALEFYDFIVFGIFAATLSQAFFPAADPLVSQLGAFATFAAGYLARPVGGLVFGARGDRRGRRGSFMLSLGVMSLATAAMGFVPTYADAGAAGTLAFVALRLVQGFCLGGELPGAITYAVEVAPANRTTLACGIVFGCVSTGVLLATGTSFALHALLPAASVEAYGWRIAFVLGGLLGGLSWMLRRTLAESPAFLRMQARLATQRLAPGGARGPLAELFAAYPARLLLGIAVTGIVGMFNGLLFAHTPAYLIRSLHYAPPLVIAAINVSVATTSVVLILGAWLGDLVSRRWLYRIGCAVLLAGALPAYGAMVAHATDLRLLFLMVGLSTLFTHGIFAAILADLFPTEVRFSGVAFSLNIGAALFSGVAPLLAGLLTAATGQLEAPGWLVAAAAAMSLVATLWLPRYEGMLHNNNRR